MKCYGLLGFPLEHSFSERYFTEKFEKEDIEATYNNYELQSIEHLRQWARMKQLSGFNVTIPYKQAVIPILDTISEEASAIGAVNVVKVEYSRKRAILLHGYNSDALGFKLSLQPLLDSSHTHALVLGTGGASKAIVYILRKLGISVRVVSRTRVEGQLMYSDIDAVILQTYKLIVNCTPLGTYPNIEEYPDLPYDLLTSEHLLYDLVYNPAETSFLRKGKERGAKIKNGYEMLILQAEEAWRIWQI